MILLLVTSLSPFNSILELFAGFNAALFGFAELRKIAHAQVGANIYKGYQKRIRKFSEIADLVESVDLSGKDIEYCQRFSDLKRQLYKVKDQYSNSLIGKDKRHQYVTDNRRLVALFYYGFFYCLLILLFNGFSDIHQSLIPEFRYRIHVFNLFTIVYIFVISFHAKKSPPHRYIAVITGTLLGQILFVFWTLIFNIQPAKWMLSNKVIVWIFQFNQNLANSSFLVFEVLAISFVPIFVCFLYPELKYLVKTYYFELRLGRSEFIMQMWLKRNGFHWPSH